MNIQFQEVGYVKAGGYKHAGLLPIKQQNVKKFRNISRTARLKLEVLNAAVSLNRLRVPPGNRLEQLKGDRKDQYSIRINNRWCVCFVWKNENAFDVEIVDYH